MSTKSIIICIAIFLAAIIGASVLLTAGQKSPPATAKYNASDSNKPIARTPVTLADLGKMKVSEIKRKDFDIINTGTKPLQILNINSSCNCTFGQLIYNGTQSSKFGMHAQSGYITDIAPGSSAVVRVTYQPSLMPVAGPIEREVYVTTNDPQKENLVFTVKADVN